jgi:hypothetical protein
VWQQPVSFLVQLIQHVWRGPLTSRFGGYPSVPMTVLDSIPCTLTMHACRHHVFVHADVPCFAASRSFMSVHCHRSCHLCSGRSKVMHRRVCAPLAARAVQFRQLPSDEPVHHVHRVQHCRTRVQAKLRLAQAVLPSWMPSPTARQQTARLPRTRRQLDPQGASPRRGPAATLGSNPLR